MTENVENVRTTLKDCFVFKGPVNGTVADMVRQANEAIDRYRDQIIAASLVSKVIGVPVMGDETIDDIEKYLVVSPLGPLRSSLTNQDTGEGMKTTKLETAVNCLQNDTIRDRELRKQLSSSTTGEDTMSISKTRCSVVFEMVHREQIMLFRVKEVHNIRDFESLPDMYKYGDVAFYMVKRGDKPELCIRTRVKTKYIGIGSTTFDEKELGWIISTMKEGGNALVKCNKEIKEVQKNAGRLFNVVI